MDSYADIKAKRDRSHPRGGGRFADRLEERGAAKRALLISVGVTVLLYAIPFGRFVAYPLLLLSTLVHELGHGVTAAALGGTFQQFVMYPDASGVASWSGSLSGAGRAAVAAGGLVGPALAGALGFVAARRELSARICLGLVALALLAADILVVRNPFGWVFCTACVGALAFAALYDRGSWAQLVLVFLSTQLALAVFSRADYLFVAQAETAQGTMPSDVAQMAEALGGTYWAWGLLVGTVSVLVLAGGLYAFARVPRERSASAAVSGSSSRRG